MRRSAILLVRAAAAVAAALGVYSLCLLPFRAAIVEGQVERRSMAAESAPDPQRTVILARENVRILNSIAPWRRLSASWYMLYGGNCGLLERWPEAIDTYTRALKIDQRPEIYFNRGLARLRLGQTDAAVADITTATRFNPYLIERIDGELRERVAAAAGLH
jgi:tetratricopeptide (TPR) repeat protein